jgi:polyphosphate glucokinase
MKVLGIDVGGSGIKGAVVDSDTGALASARIRRKTPRPAEPDAVIGTIQELIKELDYTGPLGVGFPAIVTDGVVRSATNVDDDWIGCEARRRIATTTGLPTEVINDADAAGLGETRFGAARDEGGVVIVLTLGTGIGSALFVNGRLVPNMELGHLYLRGHREISEDYASNRARTGKELSWKKWASRLDEYLQHVEGLFSPSAVVLGGGVSKKHEKFIPRLTVRTRVVPARLGNDAGIVGAALAASENGGVLRG